MSTYIIILICFSSIGLLYVFLPKFQTRLFNKYFQIYLEESYDLDDLFPIKMKGKIMPKVNFLDIPYDELNIQISTKTITGNITGNIISLELIKPGDRNKSIYLIKTYYIKTVKSYIIETIQNKSEHIKLIKISQQQKHNTEKLACSTCKHKIQCKIGFTQCNYKRNTKDEILYRKITINKDRNYKLNSLNK